MSVPYLMEFSSQEEHGLGLTAFILMSDGSILTHGVWLHERPTNVPPRKKPYIIWSLGVPYTDLLMGHLPWRFQIMKP